MSRIYLDHAATTPLRPEAREAMLRGFELWANPSSPHAEGRKARAALEDARGRIKAALGWDGEVIFTSGASEAAGLARSWSVADSQILCVVEHDSVLAPAFGAKMIFTSLGVGTDGSIDLSALDAALSEDVKAGERSLVIVQAVNSETGAAQDLATIAARVRAANGFLLSDCSQSAGKADMPDCDMAIVAGHKFGGPVGVGALVVRDFAMMDAPGGQERGYRRGTENLPAILGMVAALEACADPYIDPDVLKPLEAFAEDVRTVGGDWISDRLSCATPYIRAIAMTRMNASAQVMRFDMEGISVSQGSACSSGTMKPSRVLKAMGIDEDPASRTIRVSFGWNTTREEVEQFCEVWLAMAREAAERAA